jgi:hypothetical protein
MLTEWSLWVRRIIPHRMATHSLLLSSILRAVMHRLLFLRHLLSRVMRLSLRTHSRFPLSLSLHIHSSLLLRQLRRVIIRLLSRVMLLSLSRHLLCSRVLLFRLLLRRLMISVISRFSATATFRSNKSKVNYHEPKGIVASKA